MADRPEPAPPLCQGIKVHFRKDYPLFTRCHNAATHGDYCAAHAKPHQLTRQEILRRILVPNWEDVLADVEAMHQGDIDHAGTLQAAVAWCDENPRPTSPPPKPRPKRRKRKAPAKRKRKAPAAVAPEPPPAPVPVPEPEPPKPAPEPAPRRSALGGDRSWWTRRR